MTNPHDDNRQVMEEFRANGGKVGGLWEHTPLLLLTTRGAKSGERRITPMLYMRDCDRLIVFASAGGANSPWLVSQSAGAPGSHRRGRDRDLRRHRCSHRGFRAGSVVDQGSGIVSLARRAPGEDNPPDSGDRALPTRKLKTISDSSGGTSYSFRNTDWLLILRVNALQQFS